MDILLGHTGHGIWLILLLSLPAVLLAAGVGLIIGILQAVTQVQEQTISAAPKILLVFMLIIFGGPLMVDVLKEFLMESIHLGMEVLPHDEPMVLPPKPRLAYGEANSRMDFFKETHHPSGSKIKAMMEQPSRASGMFDSTSGVINRTTKPHPKAGVGERIYMKRRAAGNLPKPPRYKD